MALLPIPYFCPRRAVRTKSPIFVLACDNAIEPKRHPEVFTRTFSFDWDGPPPFQRRSQLAVSFLALETLTSPDNLQRFRSSVSAYGLIVFVVCCACQPAHFKLLPHPCHRGSKLASTTDTVRRLDYFTLIADSIAVRSSLLNISESSTSTQ